MMIKTGKYFFVNVLVVIAIGFASIVYYNVRSVRASVGSEQ